MKTFSRALTVSLLFSLFFLDTTPAGAQVQQYKLRQNSEMMGMKTESTIYVKGSRKRTEPGAVMGMAPIITIEQCDLQRTIHISDKKKMYYIEPFAKEEEEVIDEDVKTAPVKKTVPVVKDTVKTKKGGTIYMWYSIIDTGERKKMYGFTARHIWTTMKMKPSEDACYMKDSMVIKTDGWYIDLPQFNCPVRYKPTNTQATGSYQKPDCQDKYVTRRSGRGKLGFPLEEKRTMIMGGTKTTEFETNMGTIELISGKQDSMLFEIPPGYAQAASLDELQEKFNAADMIKEYQKNMDKGVDNMPVVTGEKKTGVIRIGVYEPKGEDQVTPATLQQYLVGSVNGGNIEAIAVANEEEARNKKCDYVLNTDFTRFKSGSKVGGLLKAVKNADPNAASSFNIEAGFKLVSLADGSTRVQKDVSGKYDGKAEEAARKALDEGARQVIRDLK